MHLHQTKACFPILFSQSTVEHTEKNDRNTNECVCSNFGYARFGMVRVCVRACECYNKSKYFRVNFSFNIKRSQESLHVSSIQAYTRGNDQKIHGRKYLGLISLYDL